MRGGTTPGDPAEDVSEEDKGAGEVAVPGATEGSSGPRGGEGLELFRKSRDDSTTQVRVQTRHTSGSSRSTIQRVFLRFAGGIALCYQPIQKRDTEKQRLQPRIAWQSVPSPA
jgi:hypothetical protein